MNDIQDAHKSNDLLEHLDKCVQDNAEQEFVSVLIMRTDRSVALRLMVMLLWRALRRCNNLLQSVGSYRE